MEETENKASHRDKYSFISLYLFILIFFVIIHELLEESADKDKIYRFINKLAYFKETDDSNIPNNSKPDRGSIYYSKKLEAYLPAEALQIKSIDAERSKKFAWEEAFANVEITASFKEKAQEIVNYVKNSTNELIITFLVSSEESAKAIDALALLASFASEFDGVKILVELEKPQSEELVRILVSNK